MTELIVNLWALYDADTGLVYGLSGKVYNVSGDEQFKLDVLKSLARTDYVTAKRYQIPSRFEVIATDGSIKKNVTHLNAIGDPNAVIFEDMFLNIESELPPQLVMQGNELVEIKQFLSDDPLCVVTTLYEDEYGNITPIVTDSDREWIREQERSRGR